MSYNKNNVGTAMHTVRNVNQLSTEYVPQITVEERLKKGLVTHVELKAKNSTDVTILESLASKLVRSLSDEQKKENVHSWFKKIKCFYYDFFKADEGRLDIKIWCHNCGTYMTSSELNWDVNGNAYCKKYPICYSEYYEYDLWLISQIWNIPKKVKYSKEEEEYFALLKRQDQVDDNISYLYRKGIDDKRMADYRTEAKELRKKIDEFKTIISESLHEQFPPEATEIEVLSNLPQF